MYDLCPQKELEESEKQLQSSQTKLEELAAVKKKLSKVDESNKALQASKEVRKLVWTLLFVMYYANPLLCYAESDRRH